MKKIMTSLMVLAMLAVGGVVWSFQQLSSPVGTSVIAEKTAMGAARLLPADLTTGQAKLLNVAYVTAKADGHKDPELVQAVLLQETHAGGLKSYRVANPGSEAYFGPMQIKLGAAKDVLKEYPRLFEAYGFHTRSDDEIKAFLILNEKFNIEVGSKYLLLLKRKYGFSGRELMNAYNRGPGGVKNVDDDYHYAIGAQQKLAAYKRR